MKEFARRLPVVYREVEGHVDASDESVGRGVKAVFVLADYATRLILQSLFIGVARECGLSDKVLKCEANGFPILTVTVGRFTFLTLHHSSKSEEMAVLNLPRIRQQHAVVNHQFIQPNMFEPQFDKAKLDNADEDTQTSFWLSAMPQIGIDMASCVSLFLTLRKWQTSGNLIYKLRYAELCDYK